MCCVTLLLAAYAHQGAHGPLQRLVNQLLGQKLSLPVIKILSAQLIRYPDQAVLDPLYAHFRAEHVPFNTDTAGAVFSLLCAAGGLYAASLGWSHDLVGFTLTFAFGDKMKDRDRNGVERHVKAHMPRGVRVHAFDTVVHDLQALAASPRDEQIADLEFAMSRRELGIDTLEPDQADWLAGDLARIDREVVAPFRARGPKSYGPFVVERHRLWADEISRLTGGDRKVLVVVGITNLAGPDSLVAMLRRRGIAVEGP